MTKKNIVGIILAGGMGTRLKELTDHLAKPAVHFGGKYRIIDFTLSNCTNSGIDTIGIITQYEPIELTSYIGSGGAWDLDIFDGGVTVLPPYTTKNNRVNWQNGTAHAVYQHLNYIDLYDPEYILVLSGDHIYKMDYSKMIEEHIKNTADVTIATIDVNAFDASRFGIVEMDDTNKIIGFEEKPTHPKTNKASMGVYVFNWKLLREKLIEFNANNSEECDFGKHLIPMMIKESEVFAYLYEDYWRDIGTIDSLWQANMELIDYPQLLNLKDSSWSIFSNASHLPAHHVSNESTIKHALVCDGSLIRGNIYRSVVSSGVYVSPNTSIINSVVMPNVQIGENCYITNAIIKKDVIIPDNTIINNEQDVTLITNEFLGGGVK